MRPARVGLDDDKIARPGKLEPFETAVNPGGGSASPEGEEKLAGTFVDEESSCGGSGNRGNLLLTQDGAAEASSFGCRDGDRIGHPCQLMPDSRQLGGPSSQAALEHSIVHTFPGNPPSQSVADAC